MIYVLGGKGFVGAAYIRLFNKLGHNVRVITRENYSSFVGSSCDVLINANGNSSKIVANREPMKDFAANVTFTRQLLMDVKCDFYIHLSSCDVYPDCSSPELTSETTSLSPLDQSSYGFHKRLGELCVMHSISNWLILRHGGFVGPGMKKNAIFDILNGGPLWLDPQSKLQFIHTDDAARIVWELYKKGIKKEVINLCGDGVVRLADVLEWVGKAVPVQPDSPVVHYEVGISRLLEFANVPLSYETVKLFVLDELNK